MKFITLNLLIKISFEKMFFYLNKFFLLFQGRKIITECMKFYIVFIDLLLSLHAS